MVELSPTWMQENCYTAQLDRLLLAGLVSDPGVSGIAGGSLLVTTGGSGLNLSVAQGGAFMEGVQDDRGMYYGYNDAPVTVTAGPNATGNPRIDQVIARVYDSVYGEGADEWQLEVLAGTPTGGATLANLNGAAALPDNSVRLAYVLVPAGFAGPFVDATHILDNRFPFFIGDRSQWHQVGAAGEPAFQNGWVADTASGYGPVKFRRRGDMVDIQSSVENPNPVGITVIFTLPPGYRPADDIGCIQMSGSTGGATINVGPSGTVVFQGFVPAGSGTYANISLNMSFPVTS